MNEHDAVDLMDRLSATVTVPPAAVDAAIAAGARTRRRRRLALVVSVPAVAVVLIGGLSVISTHDPSVPAADGPSAHLPGHVPTPTELVGRWYPTYLNGRTLSLAPPYGVDSPVAVFSAAAPLATGGFHVRFTGSDGCNQFGPAGFFPPVRYVGSTVTSPGRLVGPVGSTQQACPPGVAHPGFIGALNGRYLRIVGVNLETFTATGRHVATLVGSTTPTSHLPGSVPTPAQLTGRWTLTWLDGHPFHQQPNGSGPVRVSFDHTSPLPSGGFSLDVHGFDGCNSFSSGINPGPGDDKGATFSTDGVLHPGSLMIGAVGCLDPNVPQQRFITALANQHLRIVADHLETFDAAGHHLATLVRQP